MELKKRLFFPLFNTLIGLILGILLGYYLSNLWPCILYGTLAGLLLGCLVEFGLGLAGAQNWFYKRRALLLTLVEIVLLITVIGPYVFVYQDLRPYPHEVCCETPLDYGAESYEVVNITAQDGITLVGWYVPPRETPGAVIVLVHGARGDRRGTSWQARVLIEAGYGVLLYDMRALGESGGDTLSYGWLDGQDLVDVIEYLGQRPEVDAQRIGVMGISAGGHVALNAAEIAPEKIAAIWADGVAAQQIKDFPLADNLGEQFGTYINQRMLDMAEWIVGRQVPMAYSDLLPTISIPTTLVYCTLDDFERRVNEQYAGIAGPNVRMWRIEGYHTGGVSTVPDEYRQRMLDFFATAFAER